MSERIRGIGVCPCVVWGGLLGGLFRRSFFTSKTAFSCAVRCGLTSSGVSYSSWLRSSIMCGFGLFDQFAFNDIPGGREYILGVTGYKSLSQYPLTIWISMRMVLACCSFPVTPSMAFVVKFEDPWLEEAQLSFSHSKTIDTRCLFKLLIKCEFLT